MGYHLKQATTVLFSSSRVGLRIFKTANIGTLTFLLPFSWSEIHKKFTKNEWFQWAVPQVVLVKISRNINTNLTFILPSKLLIFIIDHAQSCFFFHSLTHFLVTATYRRFSNGPALARKQYSRTKTYCSFKIKDQIILFELDTMLKSDLRLFKLDSKTLLVYHSVITSTKWRNMKAIPTLNLLEDISIKIIGRGLLYI